MDVLILKLGATGDVVRTTPLLTQFAGHLTWLTESKNTVVLEGLRDDLRCLSWDGREIAADRTYDLIINLEDAPGVGRFVSALKFKQLWGAYVSSESEMRYTDDSEAWFDLSIISTYGKLKADTLKFRNRKTYQELVFEGLGFQFTGETYSLPKPLETGLKGDVAIAAEAGAVWPMKKWAFYEDLKQRLRDRGFSVNVLPKRSSLLEHLADVRSHRCLVGGDSLPMHFALGTGTPCVTLFTCTSPWEIYDYGVQIKIVSPLLEEFFYKRGYDQRATTAVTVDEVFEAVMTQLEATAHVMKRAIVK
jgi:hypothetical protein